MKAIATLSIAIEAASAQMQEGSSLFREFGSCLDAELGVTDGCDAIEKTGATCCKFAVAADTSVSG